MAISPGGRPADASPLAEPGHQGPRELVDYIREVAHALMRKGHPKSEAIHLAYGIVQNWAHGSGNVSPKIRAAAVKALAEQHALEARRKVTDMSTEFEHGSNPHNPRVDIRDLDLSKLATDDTSTDLDLAPGDYRKPYSWKHGYIPLTPEAVAVKAKRGKLAGKGQAKPPKGVNIAGRGKVTPGKRKTGTFDHGPKSATSSEPNISAQAKIDNAARMYGTGSTQHMRAQERFGAAAKVEDDAKRGRAATLKAASGRLHIVKVGSSGTPAAGKAKPTEAEVRDLITQSRTPGLDEPARQELQAKAQKAAKTAGLDYLNVDESVRQSMYGREGLKPEHHAAAARNHMAQAEVHRQRGNASGVAYHEAEAAKYGHKAPAGATVTPIHPAAEQRVRDMMRKRYGFEPSDEAVKAVTANLGGKSEQLGAGGDTVGAVADAKRAGHAHHVGQAVNARQPGIERVTAGRVVGHTASGMVQVKPHHPADAPVGTFNPSHVAPAGQPLRHTPDSRTSGGAPSIATPTEGTVSALSADQHPTRVASRDAVARRDYAAADGPELADEAARRGLLSKSRASGKSDSALRTLLKADDHSKRPASPKGLEGKTYDQLNRALGQHKAAGRADQVAAHEAEMAKRRREGRGNRVNVGGTMRNSDHPDALAITDPPKRDGRGLLVGGKPKESTGGDLPATPTAEQIGAASTSDLENRLKTLEAVNPNSPTAAAIKAELAQRRGGAKAGGSVTPDTARRMSDAQLETAFTRLSSAGDSAALKAISDEIDRRDQAGKARRR